MRTHVLMACLVTLSTLVIAAPAASADEGGLGVAPGVLDLTEPALLPGSTREAHLSVQNGLDEVADLTTSPAGDAADWMTVEPATLTLEPGESASLKVRVAVPDDAVAGTYKGTVRILAESGDQPDGSGAAVSMELRPGVNIRVGGDHVLAFSLEGVAVDLSEQDSPLLLSVRTLNHGNVAGSPELRVRAVPADGGSAVIDETLTLPRIEPQSDANVPVRTEAKLPRGAADYRVTLTLVGQGAADAEPRSLVLHAEPAGSSGGVKRGLVDDAQADAAPEVDAPMALTATFRNTGTAAVDAAKLVGEVYKDGRRVAILEGNGLKVAPGAAMDLVAYFTPSEPGAYEAKLRVLFDGDRTSETTVPFTVGGDGATGAGDTNQDASSSDGGGKAKTPGPGAVLVLGALGAAVALARRKPE